MSSTVCNKRKANFFIGGGKKFGGGGESECGMTQSNKKIESSQISQRNFLSVAKLSAAFPLCTSASSSTSIASSTIFPTNQRPGNRGQTHRQTNRHTDRQTDTQTDILKYWFMALSESAGQKEQNISGILKNFHRLCLHV